MRVVVLICIADISGGTTELAAVAAVRCASRTLDEVCIFWFGFERNGAGADYAGTQMKEWQAH